MAHEFSVSQMSRFRELHQKGFREGTANPAKTITDAGWNLGRGLDLGRNPVELIDWASEQIGALQAWDPTHPSVVLLSEKLSALLKSSRVEGTAAFDRVAGSILDQIARSGTRRDPPGASLADVKATYLRFLSDDGKIGPFEAEIIMDLAGRDIATRQHGVTEYLRARCDEANELANFGNDVDLFRKFRLFAERGGRPV